MQLKPFNADLLTFSYCDVLYLVSSQWVSSPSSPKCASYPGPVSLLFVYSFHLVGMRRCPKYAQEDRLWAFLAPIVFSWHRAAASAGLLRMLAGD